MPVTISEDITGVASINGGQLGGRNKIINGSMVIDQRNAGGAVTAANAYPVDRWYISNTANGSYSAQQVSDTPVGFSSSLKVTVTAAQTANTGNLAPVQIIEGNNIADLGWGAAGAKTVTLSFWVRSSLTGTFGGSLRNSASNRSYPFTYTISVADTWEYKTITIAGDTSGTWLTTNGIGIKVRFSLYAVASSLQSAGTWYAGSATGATGQTQLASTNGATFYITGVQLEKGSTATDFEHRTFGDELALCQRYYFRETAGTTFAGFAIAVVEAVTYSSGMMRGLPVPMRSLPTCNVSNCRMFDGGAAPAITSLGNNWSSKTTWGVSVIGSAGGMTVGRACMLTANNNILAYIEATAEL